ncbi:hypothetical protein Tdes44962_MAKER01925 [Teratosphaeria destructans]|uniref:Uncharacterized protein n=1 Tax=Teratosphaeria destructans TaxID=418781 RepID=A0A9W7W4V9_9PEZI|nr:hypothetical protein Tdes44962_MAKER01925 [Teratosphaeria destructans]
MDPTTLITFLFRAPPGVRAVEILGSWDNFRQPYVMHHDRRRGHGAWSGCFRFENIIFDGISNGDLVVNARPRRGGLKQGGTYWYYYRLDYDVDAFDDGKEYTTACPLLPGQPVNVIEIPVEMMPPPSRRQSACLEFENVEGTLASLKSMPRYALNRPQQTLDPDAKFAALEPPPVSKVHGRCVSDLALSGRLEGMPPSLAEAQASPAESSAKETVQAETLKSFETKSAYQSIYSGGWRSRASSDAQSSISNGHPEEASNATCDRLSPLRSFPMPANGGVSAMAPEFEHFNFNFRAAASPHEWAPGPLAEDNGEYDDDDDDSNYGPRSVRDVQMYGSRPTTSYSNSSQDFWRPRVHCIVSGDIKQRWIEAPQGTAGSQAPDDSCGSPLTSDVWSPTFSAATVSSSGGGMSTPSRRSAGYNHNEAQATQDDHKDSHLASRDASDRSSAVRIASADSSPREEQPSVDHDIHRTPTFGAYALPLPALESVQSLGKVSTNTGSLHCALSPLPLQSFLPEISTGSMADDIFSELGYLSQSIS